MERERICANNTSDKRLIPTIYKKSPQLNNWKTNNQIQKWAKDLNRCSSQEDIQIAKKNRKRCSTSLIVRGIQIKTMMKYSSHTVGWLLLETKQNDDVEKSEPLGTIGGNVNRCSYYGKQHGSSSKIKNKITMWSRNSTSQYIPKIIEGRVSKKYLYIHTHSRIINNS